MGIQALVEDFHVAMGVPVREREAAMTTRVALRADLIDEEFAEVNDEIIYTGTEWRVGSLPRLAKELADLVYVIYGWAVELDIDLDAVIREVHRSNMTKVDPRTGAVKRRADGKVLKNDHFSPADVGKVLGE